MAAVMERRSCRPSCEKRSDSIFSSHQRIASVDDNDRRATNIPSLTEAERQATRRNAIV